MEKGQRVLVENPDGIMGKYPGVVIGKGRRPGFVRVRYYCAAFYSRDFPAARLEAIDGFGQFYSLEVAERLEYELKEK